MMLSHLSPSPGVGGLLKSAPEDFLVEEIAPDGSPYAIDERILHPDSGGAYTHFVLQKTNWSTSSAISEIAKRLRTGHHALNFAGTKDKLAITTQLASVRGDRKAELLALNIKDISINGAWGATDRVHLGELLGNRFTITVRGADAAEASRRVDAVSAELAGAFPNYFGEQRFGSSRRNTHLVGAKLLEGDLEGAAMMFLCDSKGENNEFAVLARKSLAETLDFAKALGEFPRHLRLERSMLAHLERSPSDFAGALRRLPRTTLLLFVHAFQSDLFNCLLSDRLSEGPLELEEGEYFCGEAHGFPDVSRTEAEGWICGKIIGYGTPLNEREAALLENMGVAKDAFRMDALPELRSKGTYRTLMAPLKDFKFNGDTTTFSFSLPAGSYATAAMREFMDAKG